MTCSAQVTPPRWDEVPEGLAQAALVGVRRVVVASSPRFLRWKKTATSNIRWCGEPAPEANGSGHLKIFWRTLRVRLTGRDTSQAWWRCQAASPSKQAWPDPRNASKSGLEGYERYDEVERVVSMPTIWTEYGQLDTAREQGLSRTWW